MQIIMIFNIKHFKIHNVNENIKALKLNAVCRLGIEVLLMD